MRQDRRILRDPPVGVGNCYIAPMSLMLICPKCEAGTELRGTMDSWYLTWCPECERLWRLELWSLLEPEPSDAVADAASSPSARRTRSRARH
jgi:hypothetical protein